MQLEKKKMVTLIALITMTYCIWVSKKLGMIVFVLEIGPFCNI